MLLLLMGTDWVANRDQILNMIAEDVRAGRENRVLMVPELISHDMERRLCQAAGDTTSRYAEVLSFTRMARRVADSVGHGAGECLDKGGRIVAMASAARQLHNKLKAYAALETKPEFLADLLDSVDEFKRGCISSADLKNASGQTEGAFAQKLEELSLILEAYDSVCAQGKRDPTDQMNWLLEELEQSEYAAEHTFYVDGFPDFTQQHMGILEHLIQHSSKVVISLNCDKPNTRNLAMEKAGKTASDLISFATRVGVEVRQESVAGYIKPTDPVRDRLFQGNTNNLPGVENILSTCVCSSVYEECTLAAQRIISLVQAGSRYRDISVVCGDMPGYSNAVETVFRRFKIPVYISGTETILDKTVITTVLSGIEAALSGFEQRSVLRYLRTPLCGMNMDLCDQLENYILLWSVNGSRFTREWTNHPKGLSDQWSKKDEEELQSLNEARAMLVDPLSKLKKAFDTASRLEDMIRAVYGFIEDIRLSESISNLSAQMQEEGDHRGVQILDQLWEILIGALEQLYDMLGHTVWESETFLRLFQLLLSQYDVGTIPPVLDSVTVGPADAMRCQQAKHLIVLGAVEGAFPAYASARGVLSEQERESLVKLGITMSGGVGADMQNAFYEIYAVFCGATETADVFCPDGRPSYVFKRLSDLAGGCREKDLLIGPALCNRNEAGAYFARFNDDKAAEKAGLFDAYAQACRHRDHTLGNISRDNIRLLYGSRLNLSASQVDKLANCRLSYFLRYGLHAKPMKPVSVDPSEFGTFVHAVLENTGRAVIAEGGFHQVSLARTLELSNKFASDYIREHFKQLESDRLHYLMARNGQELEMVVQEFWQELNQGSFEPVEFELSFGDQQQMPPVYISGTDLTAALRGFVDRVDIWQMNGQSYFRVVDYKTGAKDFDYCDVFNGLGLQMLLYLFALEDNGQPLLGDQPVPAGVQYFPARAPYVSVDGLFDTQTADKQRQAKWKRSGLTLNDEEVLAAMEPEGSGKRLGIKRKKDGSVSGDIADRAQFRLLKQYVFKILEDLVDRIGSGCVDPDPYTRGSRHNACRFCDYKTVCNAATVAGRRNYKEMSAEEFWDGIQKEVGTNG